MARKRIARGTADAGVQVDRPHETLRLYASLLDNIPDGCLVIRDGKICYANQRLLRMTGFSQSELVGRAFTKLVPRRDRRGAREHLRKTLNRRRAVLSPVVGGLVSRDGTEIPVEVAWRRAALAGGPAAAVLLRDIRARVRAEEEVRRLSEFQSNILRNANAPIVALDTQGSVLRFNRAAERITGYRADEVLGNKTIWEKAFPDAALRRRILGEALSALGAGRDLKDFETPIRTKGGETRLLSWFAAALRDAEGRVIGSVGVGRDVTETRRAQAAAEQHRRQAETLNAVARAVLLASDVDRALEDVPRIVGRFMGADAACLYVAGGPDGPDRVLCDGPVPSVAREVLEEPGIPRAALTREVMRTGQPAVAADLRQAPVIRGVMRQMVKAGFRSAIVAPVVGRHGVLGALHFVSRAPAFFSADDATLTAAVGREIGLVIEHRLLERQLANRERRLRTLSALTRVVMRARRAEDGLRKVPSILRGLLGCEGGMLLMPDEAAPAPLLIVDGAVPKVVVTGMRQPGLPAARLTRRALRTGKPIRIDDVRAMRKRTNILRHSHRSLVLVPMVGRHRIVGTLEFGDPHPEFFTESDLAFLTTVGREIGLVIEHRLLERQLANRERRLQTLNDVTRAVMKPGRVVEGLRAVPRILRRVVGAEAACLFVADALGQDTRAIFDGDVPALTREALMTPGLPKAVWTRRVLRTGRPVVIDDVSRAPFARQAARNMVEKGYRSFVSVPVAGRPGLARSWSSGRIVGTLDFASRRVRYFTEADVAFLTAVGREIGLVIEHRLLEQGLAEREQRLEALTSQLARAAEEERHHIAALLHDDLGQLLSLARVRVDLAARHLADPDRTAADLREAGLDIERVLGGMRDLAGRLEPEILTEFDLVSALRKTVADLSAAWERRIVFAARGRRQPLSPEVARALFRIAVEATQNALRHAHARRIRVTLTQRPGRLALSVKDDGRGFDVERARSSAVGLGLRLMRDRVRGLNADLEIRSVRGEGTTVHVVVPLGGNRGEHTRAAGR